MANIKLDRLAHSYVPEPQRPEDFALGSTREDYHFWKGCASQPTPTSDPGQTATPTTVNDLELTRQMAPTLAKVVGEDQVDVLEPTMGGEDFAYFANEVPGFFFRLGMVKPGTVSGGHHTPTFLADDGSVPVGMRAMSSLLLDYLESRRGLVP